MKKLFYLLLVPAWLVTGCSGSETPGKKPDDGGKTPQAATQVLPADKATFTLEDDATYIFSWTGGEDKSQVIVFSDEADLSNKYYYEAGNSGEASVTMAKMAQVASNFDAVPGEPLKLYWAILPAGHLSITPAGIRELNILLPVVEVLVAPENLAAFDLEDPGDYPIEFKWRKDALPETVGIEIVFKLSDSAPEEAVFDTGVNSGSCTLSDLQLQEALSRLDFKPGAEATVSWNIRAKEGTSTVGIVSRKITLQSKTSVFVDVRGAEVITYKTTKITYIDGTSDIWMAENFRGTFYTNGESIDWRFKNSEALGFTGDYARLAGYMYHGEVLKGDLKAKFVSKYWHLASMSDFEKLLDSADASQGGMAVLMAENVWANPVADVSQLNAWGFNLVSTGRVESPDMTKHTGVGQNAAFWVNGGTEWKPILFSGTKNLGEDWAEGAPVRFILEK